MTESEAAEQEMRAVPSHLGMLSLKSNYNMLSVFNCRSFLLNAIKFVFHNAVCLSSIIIFVVTTLLSSLSI